MSEENQSVAGQEKKPEQHLCGGCKFYSGSSCGTAASGRHGGRVDAKAAACYLFKHV